MQIIINGWEKFNPRKDVTKPSWFRLDNSFLTDPEFYEFNSEEKMVWIGILCIASQKNSSKIKINTELLSALLKIECVNVESTIEKLVNIGVISNTSKTSRNAHVTPTSRERTATDERTNGRTNETNVGIEQKQIGAIAEFSHDEEMAHFLKSVNKSTQKLWLKTYQDENWLRIEILKAMAWLETNPQKRPKGKNPARFLGNWFSRGWESHRKTIPTSTVLKIDKSKIDAAVRSGASRLSDLDLSEKEMDWVRDKGGLVQLGRMSEFEFQKLLNGA